MNLTSLDSAGEVLQKVVDLADLFELARVLARIPHVASVPQGRL